MEVVSKSELMKQKKKYMKLLKEKIFIYPTDSIYGIGCDATNPVLVEKIRKLKKSNIQPFSIIAPSKEWVYKNCEITDKQRPFVESLGKTLGIAGEKHRFTIILKLKNKNAVARNVNPGSDTIGVRIPNHWFSDFVHEFGKPIVTTSANPTGEDFMTSLDDLNPHIKKGVDFIIYVGEKKGHPSTIIHYDDKEIKLRHRA